MHPRSRESGGKAAKGGTGSESVAAPASAPLPTPDQEEARRAELEAKLHQRLRQRRAHGPDLNQNDGRGTEALYRAIAAERVLWG